MCCRGNILQRLVSFLVLFAFVMPMTTSSSSEHSLIPLSGLHNLGTKTLVDAVASVMVADRSSSTVELDLSNSAITDSALEAILEQVFSKGSMKLHFIARTNQLTPTGVSKLIERIVTARNATTDNEPLGPSLESLDLSWNHLHPESKGAENLNKMLQKMIEHKNCPTTIRLDCCGIGPALCRAIGKGLIQRFTQPATAYRPLSLHLSGNAAIGDAGVAALAAAVRVISSDEHSRGETVLKKLDLTLCNVGDVGAEALAIALGTGLIESLGLSSNKITDVGAKAIGRALAASSAPRSDRHVHLDLSGNKDIGDKGAAEIAASIAAGTVSELKICSCSIHADGAAAFGKNLRRIATSSKEEPQELSLDLSGNPIGVLRGKKKEGNKYTAFKNTATATATSYLNQGLSFLKKGLKDVGGVDLSPMLGQSAESDDEAEVEMGATDESENDPKIIKCGAKAFANAFLDEAATEDNQGRTPRRISLGLRHCFFDHGAPDALAAVLVAAKDELGIDLVMDVTLNQVLEEEMVEALHGDPSHEHSLHEMAERHQEILEALRSSRELAAQAAATVRARIEAEELYESAWDTPRFDTGNVQSDSDGDYEDEDEYDR